MVPTIDDSYGGPPRLLAAVLTLEITPAVHWTVVAGVTDAGEVAAQIGERSQLRLFRHGRVLGRLHGSLAMLVGIWRGVADADAVVAHSLFNLPVVFSGVVCRLRRRPWILAPHGCLNPYDLRQHWRVKKVLGPLWRQLLRSVDLWSITDVESRQAVVFGARPRHHVVPPPIHRGSPVPVDVALRTLGRRGISLADPVAAGGSIVSFVGRLDPKKGIPRLLDAFDAAAGPHDVLVLAGRGEPGYERVVEEHLARAARRDQVLRPGWLADTGKTALWSLPGHFVLASDDESFGMAVAEAMGMGVPVIVTDRVGLADLVERTGSGLVTRPGVAAVAEAMRTYLGDGERRRRDGASGREAVQRWLSAEASARGLREMLDTAVRAQASPRKRWRSGV